MATISKSTSTQPLPDLADLCLVITERAPLPMATLEGATRKLLYGNPAFCRLMGRPMVKFVGRRLDELLPKRDQCLNLVDRVLRTKRPESYTESESSRPNPIFWSYTIWPVLGPDGLVNIMIQVTETAAVHLDRLAMNEALVLSSVRQHELTAAAEVMNARLSAEIAVRLEAEDKVRRSGVRYRRLFEAAQDGVLLADFHTRKITDANPCASKLLGYPRDQLIGKQLNEVGLLRDGPTSLAMFRKLKRSHEVRYEVLPLVSQSGHPREIEVVANRYLEEGHPVIQWNIRDVTARRQAAVVANRLAAIVKFSDDAIIGKDLNGIVYSWNKGAEHIFGYTAKEMVGSPIMRLIPPDRRDEEQQILSAIKQGKGVQHFETLRLTKDQRLINVSVTASAIKDASGRIIGASKIARDITAHKHAENILRRSEALFSVLIAQAPIGVYVLDAQFRLQQINSTARPIFKKIHPLIGRDFAEVVHLLWPRRVADEIERRFRRTLSTGEPYQSPEFSGRRRDTGKQEIYEWQIQRIELPAGEPGVVCFFSEISKRKQAEADQRRLAVLAVENRRAIQESFRRRVVVASLRKSEKNQRSLLVESRELHSHLRHLTRKIITAQEEERKKISRELHDDVMQTLAGINVALGALTKRAIVDPATLKRTIAHTHLHVKNSLDSVHRFARDLRPAILDDFGLIPALEAYTQSLAAREKLRIRMTADGRAEALDSTCRTVLFRVAQEALANVVRHAHASTVRLRLSKIPDAVRFEVHDNGKSFNVRTTLATRTNKRLGLLGMRERIEMVGGKLTIESAPHLGTLVRAEIPCS